MPLLLCTQDPSSCPQKVFEYLEHGQKYRLKQLTISCERHIAGNFMAIVGSTGCGCDLPMVGSDSRLRILRALAEAQMGYKLECRFQHPPCR